MIQYNFDTILNISQKDLSFIKIDISNFIKTYHLIERKDKYEPIFSSTDKYKSFPLNSKRPTKNFFQNNKWKIKNVNTLQINQDFKLLLNKLCKNNYIEISDNLINLIHKNYNKNIFTIFIKEFLKKIWFDEMLINEYIYICKIICENDSLLKLNNNIKELFITNFLFEFNKRNDYINQIYESTDEDAKFILKRKIYGTLELLGNLYIQSFITNDNLNYFLKSILKEDMKLYDFESFYKLWCIIDKKNSLTNNDIFYYKNYITNKLENLDNKRLKLLIEIVFDNKNLISDNITYINNCLKQYKTNENLDETYENLNIIDNNIVLSELIVNQLDSDFNYLELIHKFDLDNLNNIINELDLDELAFDIPNIKEKMTKLKEQLKLN